MTVLALRMHSRIPVFLFLIMLTFSAEGQSKKYYWQQEVRYRMDVKMDVQTNQLTGRQTIRYKNNSPDVLNKVFFHLYLNAFQPGSAMDVRSRNIPDPDPRVGDRISQLKPDEIGYQNVLKLTQHGVALKHFTNGTILEVELAKPIKPGQSCNFEMEYIAQVPIQIRRNGRDNKEGIRYSMSQWYPKLCEYDEDGWHAHPYIGREFYGVWGDFDVRITIDADYVVAASGVLQNAREIGHGYAPEPKSKPDELTWRFIANNVHDFMWAADPDYIHNVHVTKDGVTLHTFYQDHTDFNANWEALPAIMEEAIEYINGHFGQYPYPTYSFIQGGDGGMEYPMATLITGQRPLKSLVGVALHELLHSWYQMVLGFDESHYAWMDEGFTDYAETRTTDYLISKGLLPGSTKTFPYEDTYKAYQSLVERGIEEPLSTHADHFNYNTAYSISAYIKGSVFLHQLEYVVGKNAFQKGMLRFYDAWKFKHPDADDFIRIMEKTSDLELDWYKEYMVYSVKTIDYAIDSVWDNGSTTNVLLSRSGGMPMPVDVQITFHNGNTIIHTIPLDIMRGAKFETDNAGMQAIVEADWNWVNPTYSLTLPYKFSDIQHLEIDPERKMADMDRLDNRWPAIQP